MKTPCNPGCTCSTCKCSCAYCALIDFTERLKGASVDPNVAAVVSMFFVSWAGWSQSGSKP